ncbi:hypothetical protein BC938DRAFT_474566 [Jimgerdemannia flammicorona]|uniref:Uncharacterized protein n=1 Tax=Jimgerdemannia flammicorona TaxID=994334 RepID=A0A433Q2C7_9FUNG|nr:hypothetical protein BC938DRAFT_474566 [Jimgerdemannia flammicorona]
MSKGMVQFRCVASTKLTLHIFGPFSCSDPSAISLHQRAMPKIDPRIVLRHICKQAKQPSDLRQLSTCTAEPLSSPLHSPHAN